MPHGSFRPIALLALFLAVVHPVAASSAAASAESLPRDPAKISAELCANCHGLNLTGGSAPNLLDWFWNHGDDDESILRSMRTGWPDSGMPPFESVLSEAELRGLLALIRRQSVEFEAGRVALPQPPETLLLASEHHAFQLETFVDQLDTPWGVEFLPDGRILVSERPGRLRVIVDGRLEPEPIRGTPTVWLVQDGGLLDVIAHPDFAKNGWIYLAYSEAVAGSSMTVVIRGRIRDGAWVDSEELFRAPPKFYTIDNRHYGCRFLFDRQGHLFFTVGDRGSQNEAQDLASPLGKIHRIFDDGRIPPDNPFLDREGAWPSIWTYGNRHVQGLDCHPLTGAMWATEHGPKGGDELNRIERGRNYGWPVITHGTDGRNRGIGIGRSAPGMEQPIVDWTPSIAPCALHFYTGDKFPKWKNQMLVTALGRQELRRIETDGDRVVHQEVLIKNQGRVRDVITGPDGLIYVAFNNPGRIARLVPVKE